MRKRLWLLFFALWPSWLKIRWLNSKGSEIDSSCHLGLSYYDVERFVLKAGARIAGLNYIKGIKLLEIGEFGRIGGKFNWITASPLFNIPGARGFGVLRIGTGANITGMHFFDVQREIIIGDNTLVAGFRSAFWTHAYKGYEKEDSWGIRIGNHCYLGSQVIMTLGAGIGDKCMVGAGTVVAKDMTAETCCLIAGNPAVVRKRYTGKEDFFTKDHAGFIPR